MVTEQGRNNFKFCEGTREMGNHVNTINTKDLNEISKPLELQ